MLCIQGIKSIHTPQSVITIRALQFVEMFYKTTYDT